MLGEMRLLCFEQVDILPIFKVPPKVGVKNYQLVLQESELTITMDSSPGKPLDTSSPKRLASSPLTGPVPHDHNSAIPALKLPNSPTKTPEHSRSESPSSPTTEASLNDDLLSVYSSTTRIDKNRHVARFSMDSTSFRRSFDSSSIYGRQNRSYLLDNELHSGSMDFSPLGNNSIYEIVMNTRRKNWLRHPTTDDIPPVSLSKNEIQSGWKEVISNYVGGIRAEYPTFESTNNLKSIDRLDQLKQLGKLNSGSKGSDDTDEEFISKENENKLKDIPEFFFDKDFKLDNPRTFKKVLDDIDLHLDTLHDTTQQQRDEANQELQERLTFYLDTVEGLLVIEISKSSYKFFNALEDVDKIQDKARSIVEKLNELSHNLKVIDDEKIQSRIKLLKEMIRRKNVEKIEQGLLQVREIVSRTEKCKHLYETEKFEECLDLMDSVTYLMKGDDSTDTRVQKWTSGWPYKLLDLRAVPALSNLREFLTNIRIEIGGGYSLKLSELLLDDVRKHCQAVSLNETLKRLTSRKIDSKKHLEVDPVLRTSIQELMTKLIRCEELASSFKLYEDKFITELKNIIKEHLPKETESNDSTPDISMEFKPASSGSKLSRLIREQTPLEFQTMLERIFAHESEALRRLSRHQKLLLDLALNQVANTTPNENQHDMIMQLDIRNAVNEGIRIVQLRMGKIIAVRRDTTSSLRYDYFLKFYSINISFIQECESITGEFLTKYLSDVLAVQIKNYVSTMSSLHLKTIQNKIDQEKWIPFVVDGGLQKDVNDIISSVDLDPLNWTRIVDLTNKEEQKTEQEEQQEDEKPKGHKKSVVVSDKTFVASDSLLVAIKMIKSILALSVSLPPHYLSNFEKMCLDLLRYFNSHAISSVSITVDGKLALASGKNLSILGESLDCLTEFVTLVQGFYQRFGDACKDFTPCSATVYNQLLQQFQSSSDRIYQSHAPPPPV